MTNRIDDFLDGMLGEDALTPSERADADAARRAIDESREFLGRRSIPDLTADVMRRIEAIEHPAGRSVQTWWRRLAADCWTPRHFAIRPAYGVVAAAACLALAWFAATDGAPRHAGSGMERPQVFVQFRLNSSDAKRVQLAGSFTRWEPRYELRETAPGIWSAMVPLPEGVHDYSFVIDGEQWVADPYASHVSDGFGGTNSRMTLLLADGPRS